MFYEHKQYQNYNYLVYDLKTKFSPPATMYRVEEEDIESSYTTLFLFCCLQFFSCLKLSVILNAQANAAVQCIAECCCCYFTLCICLSAKVAAV